MSVEGNDDENNHPHFFHRPYSITELNLSFALPIVTSFLSLSGSVTILFILLRKKRGRLSSTYERLMYGMSCMNVLSSSANSLATLPSPADDPYYDAYGKYYQRFPGMGTTATCTAQGFLFHFGQIGTTLYYCTLSIYYVLIVRIMCRSCIKEGSIQRRIEPILHGIPILYSLSTSIFLALTGNFNNATSVCWISPYPFTCRKDPSTCTRGRHALLYRWIFSGIPVILIFFIILTCMFLLINALRKRDHRKQNKRRRRRRRIKKQRRRRRRRNQDNDDNDKEEEKIYILSLSAEENKTKRHENKTRRHASLRQSIRRHSITQGNSNICFVELRENEDEDEDNNIDILSSPAEIDDNDNVNNNRRHHSLRQSISRHSITQGNINNNIRLIEVEENNNNTENDDDVLPTRRSLSRKTQRATQQALLYIAAYFITFIFTLLFQLVYLTTRRAYYTLYLLEQITTPSQGFINFLVFIRPYIQQVYKNNEEEGPGNMPLLKALWLAVQSRGEHTSNKKQQQRIIHTTAANIRNSNNKSEQQLIEESSDKRMSAHSAALQAQKELREEIKHSEDDNNILSMDDRTSIMESNLEKLDVRNSNNNNYSIDDDSSSSVSDDSSSYRYLPVAAADAER